VLAAALAVLAAAAPWATGYSPSSDYAARDYVTGFPTSPSISWAPTGIAFDQSDNLYVVDSADSNIYWFGLDGGTASPSNRLTPSPIAGGPLGMAIGPDGHIYVARHNAGDVVEIDPASGAVLRTVATGITCATGLAVDPVSGDLFVSQNDCGSTVFRVSGFQHGPGTTSPYSTNDCCVDGLTFGSDGTLYASSGGQILAIAGTASPSAGSSRLVATVPHSDGLAFAPVDSSGVPPYLVVNRNDGIVTRVDQGPTGATPTDILTGGTRGDLAAVDSRGCLYVTQADSVVEITPAHGTCGLVPSTPGARPPAGLALSTVSATTRRKAGAQCRRMTRLTIRLRQRGRIRLASATVYLNGRRVRSLHRRAATAPIVLSRLPKGRLTVTVKALTTSHHRLSTTRRFANCAPPPPAPKHKATKHRKRKKAPRKH
jgi:DNA-binding beta-propeller fold protein YncE